MDGARAAGFDPIAARAAAVADVLRHRRRLDPGRAALALSAQGLAWCGALGLFVLLLDRLAPTLGATFQRHGIAVSVTVLVAGSLLAHLRSRARAARWRGGWLGALPQIDAAIPRALRRAALRDSAWSLVVLAVAALVLRWLHPDAAGWPQLIAMLAVAAAILPTLAARHVARAGGQPAAATRGAGDSAPRGAVVAHRLPPAAAHQLLSAIQGWRGRGLWFRVAPVLLLVPAGVGGGRLLLLLFLLFGAMALGTLWLTSLRCVLSAAELLRAAPYPPGRRITAWLALPASVLGCALVLLGGVAAVTDLRLALIVLLGSAGVAVLQAACVFASAADRRSPRLRQLLHFALLAGTWQVLPSAVPMVYALQSAWLWRRARRP
ncbi:hypothetical protein [Coralloluteibacterium thermophilus]|uniref:Uncharacterized protein n=1 Tax=Coralloluteibacterium thermophilum TaxID=2707049 RepID=A0ABV9NP97_9GAMM